jgi:CheY-like chemotaxis protein
MATAPGLRSEALSIVVADEDPQILHEAVEALREAGHRVYQAYDGRAALALCLQLPALDVFVSNTSLRSMDGPHVIHRVRQAKPGLPILHIVNPGQPDRAEDLPPDVPSLRAPFKPAELRQTIENLVQR